MGTAGMTPVYSSRDDTCVQQRC